MERSIFREHKIERTCNCQYDDYKKYIPYLKKDFKARCAYCNTPDHMITDSFSADHFIPRLEFEKANMLELDNDYNNLMYCCPKCNKVKSSQFSGDIKSGIIRNDYFYNPSEVDLGTIFYRDLYGGISSEDLLGKEMIIRLKLYSPIFNLIFLVEIMENRLDKIENLVESEKNLLKKSDLSDLYMKLNKFIKELREIICLNYYDASKLHWHL